MNNGKQKDLMIMPALSNNSHELFHSNLWAWLIKIDNNFIKVFFDDFDVKKFQDVHREKDNIDLCIEDIDGNYYIIENKFKSAPNEEQLLKYKSKIDKKNGRKNKYLLTHLIDTEIKVKGWELLGYEELIKRIRKQLEKDIGNEVIKKYKSLLDEYCDYVEEIISKLHWDFFKNECYYSGEEIPQWILSDPMKAIYLKLKGEDLRIYIDKKLSDIVNEFNKKGYKLKSNLSYNHGKATLTYFIQLDKLDEPSKHASIEIQIEGSQYRYMARMPGTDEKEAEKYAFACFKGTGYFNERYDKKTNNVIHGRKSSMEGKKTE